MDLSSQIEAILFWKGEPLSLKRLALILGKDKDDIRKAVKNLEDKLEGRGIAVMVKDDEVTLATAKEMSGIIETLTREELVRDLGRAGLETLSIIIYRGPVSRSEIDYIRGVNSQFILRNLLVRGLIEKTASESDGRSFLYKPTFELLSFLGAKKAEDLPEYEKVRMEMEKAKEALGASEEHIKKDKDE